MTVKTISRINQETFEVSLSTRELTQLAVEKLIATRPDLKGKTGTACIEFKGGVLGMFGNKPDAESFSIKLEYDL